MNNNLLLSLASSVLPILSIGFVGFLLLYKLYIKIRSNFNATVNCWFCNQNARVPYLQSNSWTCPKCEQYNGFTKDGDYNRDLYQQQLDCSSLSGTGALTAGGGTATNNGYLNNSRIYSHSLTPPRNGFCGNCNEAQRLKVEKLAQFEPKKEKHFDKEFKVYKAQLEKQYSLCTTCNHHLRKVLREKKKMVLGTKFLDFIINGAETLKKPHFKKLRMVRQQHWKQLYSIAMIILTLLNIICLCGSLPALNGQLYIRLLGKNVGQHVFLILSHLLAFVKVIWTYSEVVTTHPIAIKFILFLRTLFMMLLYTMGLKWPQVVGFQFSHLYMLSSPFVLLGCAFAYNFVDGFKLTRYTFLLGIWSAFAGGLVEEKLFLSQNLVMLLASVLTLLLCATCNNAATSTKSNDNNNNSAINSSFHKLYTEEEEDRDYFSDEETISSNNSCTRSYNYNNASSIASACSARYNAQSRPLHHHSRRPLSSSSSPKSKATPLCSPFVGGAHLTRSNCQTPPMSSAQCSPNSHARSFCYSPMHAMTTATPTEALSMYNFTNAPTAAAANLPNSIAAASNWELHRNNHNRRAHSVYNDSSAAVGDRVAAANALNVNNASFRQPFAAAAAAQQPLRPQCNLNESFLSSCSNNNEQQQQHCSYLNTSSSSNNTLYSATSQHSLNRPLLTPSRFSANYLSPSITAAAAVTSPSSASSSWLSGGYFNQHHQPQSAAAHYPQTLAKQRHNIKYLFGEARNGINSVIPENLSRASSQSSGFESQNERATRENSIGVDGAAAVSVAERTLTADQSMTSAFTSNAFKPIKQNGSNTETLQHTTNKDTSQSMLKLNHPLSVSCSSLAAAPHSWLDRGAAVRSVNGFLDETDSNVAFDSFNFRKINEDLPIIRRGDLLRKWKEGQAVS